MEIFGLSVALAVTLAGYLAVCLVAWIAIMKTIHVIARVVARINSIDQIELRVAELEKVDLRWATLVECRLDDHDRSICDLAKVVIDHDGRISKPEAPQSTIDLYANTTQSPAGTITTAWGDLPLDPNNVGVTGTYPANTYDRGPFGYR